MFRVNPLPSRGFTCNIKPYFLQKIKVKLIKVSCAAILLGALRVNLFFDRWPTRVFATECLRKIIVVCEEDVRHFNLEQARNAKKDTGG